MASRVDTRRGRERAGFTLIEIAIVLAIIGVVTAIAVPNVLTYQLNARGRAAARSVADAFNVARAQAIRTGHNQIVFFAAAGGTDTAGNALEDQSGSPVPILVLDDGAPGSADQNCEIDAGEPLVTFNAEIGVGWGNTSAPSSAVAPYDEAVTSIPASGVSFFAPNGSTAVTWVQFRPDGIPIAIDSSCSAGSVGSGGGTVYLSTEIRDYAVTLTPVGGVRVHTFNPGTGAWTS